jgi:guanylate kinase
MKDKFIVITGASGAGKTTVMESIIKRAPNICQTHKSYTTRKPRGLSDYESYHFVTEDIFLDKIRNNEFIEWEEIYNNSYYGTPKSGILNGNKYKILVKDVKGSKILKKLYRDQCFLIYLKCKDIEILKERITKDGDRDKLKERYDKMEYENSFMDLGEDLIIDTVQNSIESATSYIVYDILNKF